MRNFLIKILERWQRRLYNQKDDLRDWGWMKKELDKCLKVKDMIVEIDRTDICNMLSGVEPSYEEMDRLERMGLGYYVGGFNDEWHWSKNRFKDFSDEELLEIYKSIR